MNKILTRSIISFSITLFDRYGRFVDKVFYYEYKCRCTKYNGHLNPVPTSIRAHIMKLWQDKNLDIIFVQPLDDFKGYILIEAMHMNPILLNCTI